jgi:hypothetical protein
MRNWGFACVWLLIAALCLPVAARAQKPSTDAASYDTQDLLNDVHQMGVEDLARLKASAELGDARSQVLLGLAYEIGAAGLMPQSTEALSWFLKAAEQGVAWAEGWAADFYYSGSPGVARDLDKALALYRSAANRGDPRAAFFVGQMYFYGDGVPTNHRDAVSWFRRAGPADPELIDRMIAIAEAPCDTPFCVSLHQVMGAIMTGSGERLIDGWDNARREWDAVIKLPDTDRCGLTSSDRTDGGDVQNYFCDSAPVADDARGAAMAQQLADQVQQALPAGFSRNERRTERQGPATFFARDGYPHLRVSYNTTPGAAQHRVTLLVGP